MNGGQNVSSAVMASRVEARDSLDDFPTPPWATRALCEWLSARIDEEPNSHPPLSEQRAWEPACNRGFMARPLAESFRSVHASDVHDYSAEWEGQHRLCDFLFPLSEPPSIAAQGVDWIITNPPFRLAADFIRRSGEFDCGYAMFVRLAFLEGGERWRSIYSNPALRPNWILAFSERVPLVKGRVDPEVTTATAYCWLVRFPRSSGEHPLLDWIPPGARERLERPGDYGPAAPAAVARHADLFEGGDDAVSA
ncbi:hypothetical protein [Minwuia thermotolerans]|uniref:hypothetical protein n=1 Tax=Minwuia thermotolerans TaxID=2056226 RepID=UPI0019D24887|nr:hypothetical protein [Minwuia thermotolerans]